MEIKKYVEYIKECKKRGFDNFKIKTSLLDKGWPESEVDNAFNYIMATNALDKKKERGKTAKGEENKLKNSVTIFLDNELLGLLEKRAKKNILTLPDLIEDILRRSTLSQKLKKSPYDAKVDDALVGVFSRKNTGPKRGKKVKN